jgi:acyl carrier protein
LTAEGGVTDSDDVFYRTIVTALEPFRKGSTEITPETDISQDLNLDSLAVMDLMMELEEKFDVSIPLNLLPEVRTVGDLAATVRKLKEG